MRFLTTFILVAIATLAVAYKDGDDKEDIQRDHLKDEIASLSKEEAKKIVEDVFDELDESEDDVKQADPKPWRFRRRGVPTSIWSSKGWGKK